MDKEVELINVMIQRGYVSLDPTNKNNVLLEVKYDDNSIRTESVPILNAIIEISDQPEQYQEIKDTIDEVKKRRLSLTEFLEFFDFDYEIVSDEEDYDKKYIKLVDLTGANLGDIENDLLLVTDSMMDLFERLDIYFNDYIFLPLQEKLEQDYHMNSVNMTWEEMYEYAITQHISFEGEELCPYIFQEKQLNLNDYINKMILNDIPFTYSFKEELNEELDEKIEQEYGMEL